MSVAPETADLPRLDQILVSKIKPNANNPRLVFPQEELDRLAESIDLEGVLVPIVVHPQDDHFVLVDGERRFRCALTLGLESVPALITTERPERDVLIQMFNIHLIREPWRDMPTALALGRLMEELQADGSEVTDTQLRDLTGLTVDRVKQLRFVLTLPQEWQDHISSGQVPLNYFWEMKRNVIDALARSRPKLAEDLGADAIASAFVEKRLDGVVTDTVGLRKVRTIINYAKEDADTNDDGSSVLDGNIRDLITNPDLTIDEVYEDTIQVMVEADKLERRTRSMLASFERLLQKARTKEDIAQIKEIGNRFIEDLRGLLK